MKDLIVDEPRTAGYQDSRTYVRARNKPKVVVGEDEDGYFVEDRNARRGKMTRTTKHFGDHIMPLKRFLLKNVGRAWDDVWSEICQFADHRNVRGRHLREHVDFWVHTKVTFDEEGNPQSNFGYWGGSPLYEGGLYVHPETGVLCRVEVKRSQNRKPVNRNVRKDPHNSNALLEKVEGIWYRTTYNTSQRVAYDCRRWETTSLRSSPWPSPDLILTQTSKKQLNRKELRGYNLTND